MIFPDTARRRRRHVCLRLKIICIKISDQVRGRLAQVIQAKEEEKNARNDIQFFMSFTYV